MKLVLLFLSAFVAFSHQQFQHPRGLVWISPYTQSQQPILHEYQQALYYRPNEDVDGRAALRRRYRPQSFPISYLQNEEFATISQDVGEEDGVGGESKIRGVDHGERLLYSSIINNPFYKTATFTITSTVTTLGSIVRCVPANNLAAVPAPNCSGRKKRELEDDNQFPIVPSETLSLMPTAVPSADKGVALDATDQPNSRGLFSSKDEAADSSESSMEDEQKDPLREKRFFGGGGAASTTLTSYSFVGATATSTVLLDPTGMNVAVCIPAGYVVC
ncbi:uncharacterized protein LOC130689879 [Daphnia carinata]|uniref:uncharacterized protein LOC130689879 n=1 Tax=Daphnia carinata TaxID=120202 RepID=UPI00257FBDF2|nr:uncharacterized protein LOC130689879 [Daphnia carinata]